ncbi:MAG: carboxylesterase family protein, partial [Bacteroidales bacterium]|nr:carboxylesterase family protein [Bacteroidales bacterium]
HTFGSPMILKMGMQILFETNTSVFSADDISKIESFMATTTCEDGWELPEFYNELMFRLPALQQAEYQSENGADVYMYYWRYPASMPHYGASHISELSYVFGNLDCDIYTGSDNLDTLLSNRIQDIWVNFARTGTPTDGTYTMSKYNTTLRATTFFNSGNDITTEIKPLDSQRELLSPSLKYNVNGNFMHLSLNVPFVWKACGILVLTIGIITTGCILIRKRRKKD